MPGIVHRVHCLHQSLGSKFKLVDYSISVLMHFPGLPPLPAPWYSSWKLKDCFSARLRNHHRLLIHLQMVRQDNHVQQVAIISAEKVAACIIDAAAWSFGKVIALDLMNTLSFHRLGVGRGMASWFASRWVCTVVRVLETLRSLLLLGSLCFRQSNDYLQMFSSQTQCFHQ